MKMTNFFLRELNNGETIYLPEVIDTHVHGRWEEYAQQNIGPLQTILEGQKGGIGTFCFMPNTKPGLTNMKNIEKYTKLLEEAKYGKSYMYVWLRDDNLSQVEQALKQKNVVGIKVYPASADSGKSVTTSFGGDDKPAVIDNRFSAWASLDKAFKLAIQYDKVISFHAETPALWHGPEAEIDYVNTVIIPYAKKYPDAKIIVAHASVFATAKAIIKTNKEFQTNITMELTPHHLFFSQDDVNNNPKLKCFPPLRSEDDVYYLKKLLPRIWEEWLNIMFWSDHAPHPREKKDIAFEAASGGIPNSRDSIAIILSLGVEQNMTYDQLVQFTSGTAHKLLKIDKLLPIISFQTEHRLIDYDYYDGEVYNPFKGQAVRFSEKN